MIASSVLSCDFVDQMQKEDPVLYLKFYKWQGLQTLPDIYA